MNVSQWLKGAAMAAAAAWLAGTARADTLSLVGPNADAWKVQSASEKLTFTVSRTGSEGDLDVTLASSRPEFVSVPESVTIHDGATSETFMATVALQGSGDEATISATQTGGIGAEYTLRGPKYTMQIGAGEVDAETKINFWVTWEDNGVRDDSKLSLAVEPEGALTVPPPSEWTWNDDVDRAYVASQFTVHKSGKMILKFDGVEMGSQSVTVLQPGATLSGPTALYVGETGTYTLDVVLTGGMEDTFRLVADDDDLVLIEPADAQLTESGKLEFAVKALAEGSVTLSVEDDEGLDEHVAPLTVTISEGAPCPALEFDGDSDGTVGTPVNFTVDSVDVSSNPEVRLEGFEAPTGSSLTEAGIVCDWPDVSFTPDVAGDYVFHFSSGEAGASDYVEDSVTVTVCAQEAGPALDTNTLSSLSFADGFSGEVSAELQNRYSGVKLMFFVELKDGNPCLQEVDNESAWPRFSCFPAERDGFAGLGLSFIRKDGEGEELSADALGYAKRTVPARKWQIVSMPFRNFHSGDGTYKFGETPVADDLPQGSSVLFWDGEKQAWTGGGKSAKGWAPAQANHVIGTGEAFFVRNNSDADLKVTAAGVLPKEAKLSRSYAGGSVWSVMAPMYPCPVKFGETALENQLPQGSTVQFWDADDQIWSGGNKSGKGWSSGQANHVVEVGEGFFIRTGNEGTWEHEKPYTWP